MESSIVDDNGKTLVSPDCRLCRWLNFSKFICTLQRCAKVPWNSLTSMVSHFMMVNDTHQWPLIHWIFLMFDFNSFIHMRKIEPCRSYVRELWFMTSTIAATDYFANKKDEIIIKVGDISNKKRVSSHYRAWIAILFAYTTTISLGSSRFQSLPVFLVEPFLSSHF